MRVCCVGLLSKGAALREDDFSLDSPFIVQRHQALLERNESSERVRKLSARVPKVQINVAAGGGRQVNVA